jgi:hypothetical protein
MSLLLAVVRRMLRMPPSESLTDTQRIMRLEDWMILVTLLVLTAHPGFLALFKAFFAATASASVMSFYGGR